MRVNIVGSGAHPTPGTSSPSPEVKSINTLGKSISSHKVNEEFMAEKEIDLEVSPDASKVDNYARNYIKYVKV